MLEESHERGRDDLAHRIDHTLLRPDATANEIDTLCDEAREHGFAAVCVHGIWVRRASQALSGSAVATCTVVGFPLGASRHEVKAFEASLAIDDGATEIDMVMNLGALKSGDDTWVERDVAAVAEVCRRGRARLKVILETALLDDAQKVRACRIAERARADFVKTSTGFAKNGASIEDVRLLRRSIAASMGVKAAGGIRDARTAWAMIEAGATRLGTSASVAIVTERR